MKYRWLLVYDDPRTGGSGACGYQSTKAECLAQVSSLKWYQRGVIWYYYSKGHSWRAWVEPMSIWRHVGRAYVMLIAWLYFLVDKEAQRGE